MSSMIVCDVPCMYRLRVHICIQPRVDNRQEYATVYSHTYTYVPTHIIAFYSHFFISSFVFTHIYTCREQHFLKLHSNMPHMCGHGNTTISDMHGCQLGGISNLL